MGARQERAKLDFEIKEVLADCVNVEQQQQRLLDLYLKGTSSVDILQQKRTELEERSHRLNTQIEHLEAYQELHLTPQVVLTVKELAAELCDQKQ